MLMRGASGGGDGRARARGRRAASVVASAGLALGVVAASGATAGAANKSTNSTLDIAAFLPFSGTNASYGPLGLSGCYPAVYGINKTGGVLGHKLACTSVDDRGDPADAVPAANGLIAHDGNVVAVFGPSSTTALATTSTLFSAHLPTFLMTGDAKYDHTTNPYMWRFTPPDAATSWAKAAYAKERGITKAATVYSTTTVSEKSPTAAISGFKNLHGTIVAHILLTPGQPSYSTEAEQIANAHPQVIFYTAPASTSATFLAELKQLMGKLPPLYLNEAAEEPSWVSAVSGAVGATTLKSSVAFETASGTTSTVAWKTFHTDIMKDPQKVPDVKQYFQDPFTLSYYDAANLVALAMVKAGSTSPAKFDRAILSLTEPGKGKTVVQTFAQGEQAIKAGKQIEYVGADGRLDVNKFHNVAGVYDAVREGAHPTRLGVVDKKLVDKAAL
jgi:ABC-type branched-subunit amino acid transport system substrate-binding protein